MGFGQTAGGLRGVLAGYQGPRWADIELRVEKKKKRNSFSSCTPCMATAASHCSTTATAEGHRCRRETGDDLISIEKKVINIKYLSRCNTQN